MSGQNCLKPRKIFQYLLPSMRKLFNAIFRVHEKIIFNAVFSVTQSLLFKFSESCEYIFLPAVPFRYQTSVIQHFRHSVSVPLVPYRPCMLHLLGVLPGKNMLALRPSGIANGTLCQPSLGRRMLDNPREDPSTSYLIFLLRAHLPCLIPQKTSHASISLRTRS